MKIATFKVWWIFLLLFMACSGGENEPVEPVVPETPVVTPPQPEKVDTLKQEPIPKGEGYAWDIARKLGLGWNLGNQMDAHDNGVANETCWGNQPATQQTFNKLAEAGITSVRIPVTWMGHIGEAPDYRIEEAWLNRAFVV